MFENLIRRNLDPGGQPHSGAAPGATPWGAIAGLAGGLISGISGAIQKHKANKILGGLQYPTEQLPSEITQNQQAATRMAATGLPSEQYANAMKNIQRQQLMALRGAHDRRGGLGIISGIQQGTNDATLNLDTQDAQMKLANQKNLMAVNNQVAGWKSRLFNANQRGQYNQQYNYGMGLLGMGNQNLNSGIDKFASGGIGLFAGLG
jgi:hypothetical protein